jgi:hypothetical protein
MFLQAGEVGVELIEAVFEFCGLTLKDGQEFVVVGVELVGQGDTTGADAVAGGG